MNTYEIVTERIINLLEQGVIPWRRPWSAAGAPRNVVSKKIYRGVNFFLLSATKYISPYWLTLRQANELGGSVLKGEHGQIVIFWKGENRTEADRESGSENIDDSEHSRPRFVLKFYRVFNLQQCELPQAVTDTLPKIETYQHDPIEAVMNIITGMPNPPAIVRAGSKAYYSPITDRITLPPRELFENAAEHAATTLHELSHSSGHEKRLGREGITEVAPYGSPVYSREELVAELSAAFLCAEAGISNAVIQNQAAYVSGWLKRLRDDRKLIVYAAAQAQRSADYILNQSRTE